MGRRTARLSIAKALSRRALPLYHGKLYAQARYVEKSEFMPLTDSRTTPAGRSIAPRGAATRTSRQAWSYTSSLRALRLPACNWYQSAILTRRVSPATAGTVVATDSVARSIVAALESYTIPSGPTSGTMPLHFEAPLMEIVGGKVVHAQENEGWKRLAGTS